MKWLFILCLFSSVLNAQEAEVWTLEKCIAYAVKNNLDIEKSKLGSQEASLNLQSQKSNLLPSINAAATHGYNWGQSIDPFTNEFATDRVRNNNFYLSGDWTLFNGLQTHYGIQKASHELNAQQYNQKIQERNLKIDVTAAYLQVILNYYQYQIQESTVEKTNSIFEQRKRLLKYEEITDYEILEIEAQLALDSSQLIQSKNQLKLAELKLKQVMNYREREPLAFTYEQSIIDSRITQTSRDTSFLEQEYYKEQLESVEYGKKAARSQMTPRLSISSSIGSGYSGNSKDVVNGELVVRPFDQQLENNFYQSATLNLQIPIFNKTQVRQEIKRIELSRKNLLLEQQQAVNQVQTQIDQLVLEIQSLEQQIKAQEKAAQLNQRAFEIAQEKLKLEIITFTQFIEARNKKVLAENELISSEMELELKRRILGLY